MTYNPTWTTQSGSEPFTGDVTMEQDLHVSGSMFTSGGSVHTTAIHPLTSNDDAIVINDGGSVEIYHNNSKVVETTAYGLDNPLNNITINNKTGWDYNAKDDITLSFDDSTMALTVSASTGSHEFWVQGVKYTKTGPTSAAITDTEGEWYFTYNTSGNLTASQTAWEIENEDAVLIANGYWDATNNEMNFLGMELHSFSMPTITHYHLHEVVGTLYEEGLGITDNADGTLDISGGQLHDEDISIIITDDIGSGFWDQVLSPAEMPIYYKDGASGNWRKVYNGTSTTYFTYQDGGDNPYWNQFTGGVWQLTASVNNNNTAWWILATNNIDEPVVIVMGQGAPNNTESTAINNNPINSLDLGDFGGQEYKVIYRVMVKNTGAPYVTGTITDYRTAQSVGGTGPTVNDHGALNGLGDDDHIQYSLVDGTRPFTGVVGGITPVAASDLATKGYADAKTPGWTYTSIVNTTSGTSVTLTSAIPTTALEIEVLFNGVSTNTANQPPIVRLGDAGGIETTGYVGVVRSGGAATAVTGGLYVFRAADFTAANLISGKIRLSRWDSSLHLWIADALGNSTTNLSHFSGTKTTSEVLTTIALTTPGGTATFDAGSARVRYR